MGDKATEAGVTFTVSRTPLYTPQQWLKSILPQAKGELFMYLTADNHDAVMRVVLEAAAAGHRRGWRDAIDHAIAALNEACEERDA